MKLLFITHDASRSGAPLILLYFIKWLKAHSENIECDILFVRAGVLEADFKEVCNQAFYVKKGHEQLKFSELVLNKVKSKLGVKAKNASEELFTTLATNDYNIIYANTIISVPFGVSIKNSMPNAKLLLHIHELNTQIKILLPNFKNFINDIDGYIAASNIVKDNLLRNWQVPEKLIDVIYEFSVFEAAVKTERKAIFTVGSSGLSYWRKGNDVFLQVARYIKKHYASAAIQFIWVGNEFQDKTVIDEDIEKLGLQDYVHFIGEKKQPFEVYSNFDIFLLASREDPFPLVCIEAAYLKKPIVCFENASGTAEIIKKGGGLVVPYLDIEAMAEAIICYYNNPDKLTSDGEVVKDLFAEFTPENQCPLIYKSIKNLL